MKIIGAGFGRTGTVSAKKALEILGFGPCYHMIDVIQNPHYVNFWLDVHAGKPVDWAGHFQKYQAAIDFPVCNYHAALQEVFPDARVILTVRDPDRWYESTRKTIYPLSFLIPGWEEPLLWPIARFYRMVKKLVWEGVFEGRFEDRAFALEVYRRHIEAVQRTVPADKLLVFDVREGWSPLCAFLGVPEPERAFPHLNDTRMVKILIGIIRTLTVVVPLGLAVLLGSLLLTVLT
ncbi:MAG TPA: sulfotransferase [Anaerolineales bacterium]|nr:sulfotransferase [Anaerolineales bacterium]